MNLLKQSDRKNLLDLIDEFKNIEFDRDKLSKYAKGNQIQSLAMAQALVRETLLQIEILLNDDTLYSKVKNPVRTKGELISTKKDLIQTLVQISNAYEKVKPPEEQASKPIIHIDIKTQNATVELPVEDLD
ncbi:TPA: hypothetical protein [Aquificae Joseph's Coat Spring virus]|nr:TPA: hypothetical protein [Aquificae Joseph's Coat Spring virus]